MKKQMSMDTTDLMISDVEKSHECVIEKGCPRLVAGASRTSIMNLPYHSMSFVDDNEVKLASGQRITIVVGDMAQQTVYLNGILLITCLLFFQFKHLSKIRQTLAFWHAKFLNSKCVVCVSRPPIYEQDILFVFVIIITFSSKATLS